MLPLIQADATEGTKTARVNRVGKVVEPLRYVTMCGAQLNPKI